MPRCAHNWGVARVGFVMVETMKTRPRTIQIYLPDGEPRGIRVAELTTNIIRVVEIPRARLLQFQEMPESNQVGLYFLFGDGETQEPIVYIGQSGCIGSRLAQHHISKDFWTKALVVVSMTNNLTQTHALFLEWFSLQSATQIGRYGVINGNMGTKPHTPAPLQADCEDIYDTARLLLTTLGFPLFEPLTEPLQADTPEERFYCKGVGADGTGEYTTNGFVVLKGSKGRLNTVASYGFSNEAMRTKLIQAGVLVIDGDYLVFTKDHEFKTPSSASMVLLGRTSNGWVDWKSIDGKTLAELKRQ